MGVIMETNGEIHKRRRSGNRTRANPRPALQTQGIVPQLLQNSGFGPYYVSDSHMKRIGDQKTQKRQTRTFNKL